MAELLGKLLGRCPERARLMCRGETPNDISCACCSGTPASSRTHKQGHALVGSSHAKSDLCSRACKTEYAGSALQP